jgi:hypothetical protein
MARSLPGERREALVFVFFVSLVRLVSKYRLDAPNPAIADRR